MDDESRLIGLTSLQVAQAIGNLDPLLPQGERRYEALKAELSTLFGQSHAFTSPGLTVFESWVGQPVRGEPALPL